MEEEKQKNIQEFLFKLKESYASTCSDEISTPGKSSEPLRFVVLRIRGIGGGNVHFTGLVRMGCESK
jgi:hypothetical protein